MEILKKVNHFTSSTTVGLPFAVPAFRRGADGGHGAARTARSRCADVGPGGAGDPRVCTQRPALSGCGPLPPAGVLRLRRDTFHNGKIK